MKKIKSIILIFLISTIMPIMVNADCASIGYKDYKAIVSNINGANTYEGNYNNETKKYEYKKKDVVIPYGIEILIHSDAVKTEDDYFLDVSYNGKVYSVKASDLKNVKDFKKGEIELQKSEYYVYRDTEVRSGPGVLYDIVGTIKADTNIFIMKDFENLIGPTNESGSWIYISDGTISGYIYYGTCTGSIPISIGKKVENNKFYYLDYDDKGIGLKFGDKLNVKYVIEYAHHTEYYVEYNGECILLSDKNIGKEYNYKLTLITLSDEYLSILEAENQDKELKKEDYLKVGNVYNIKYTTSDEFYDYYYIEINGKMYIVRDCYNGGPAEDYDYSLVIFDKEEKIEFKEDMYYGFDTNNSYNIMKKGKTITGYKLLNNTYKKDVYYNSEFGFFYKVSDSNITVENNVIVVDGLSASDYVTMCLIGAILLSLIVTIIIIVINKKKKNNQNFDMNISGK